MIRWVGLLLALVVSTAGAGRLTTFEWKNLPECTPSITSECWPAGATIELCSNGGICQSELTGTQATLDLPVNPGDVIIGKARVVAPSNYFVGALPKINTGTGRLTTFAWNIVGSWPPGTTVEICGNGGVCKSGITESYATLDLQVKPGEAIQGRARVVAPAGYQCGSPPVPCPYSDWQDFAPLGFVCNDPPRLCSEWATVEATWPKIPTGLWATQISGKPYMSLVVNSSSERLERTSGHINHNSAYTLMAWVRIDTDLNDYTHFFAIAYPNYGAYENSDWFGTTGDGTTSRIGAAIGGASTDTTSDNLTVGTWYHLALVRESATSLKGYINGTLKMTVTRNITGRSASSLETYGNLYDYPAYMTITAIKGWSAALSSTEVAAEKDQYAPVRTSNLLHYVPAYSGTLSEQLIAVNGSNLTSVGSITSSTDAPGGVTPPVSGSKSYLPPTALSKFMPILVR